MPGSVCRLRGLVSVQYVKVYLDIVNLGVSFFTVVVVIWLKDIICRALGA